MIFFIEKMSYVTLCNCLNVHAYKQHPYLDAKWFLQSTKNIFAIASTHISQKLDPLLIALMH